MPLVESALLQVEAILMHKNIVMYEQMMMKDDTTNSKSIVFFSAQNEIFQHRYEALRRNPC
jgi:hypothetical protein